MISAAYDENGYLYDVNSGNYLSVYYDDGGNAYSASTDEPVLIVADYTQGNPGFDNSSILETIENTLIGIFGRPNYQQPRNQYPQAYYPGNYTPAAGSTGVRLGTNVNNGGIGANISLPKWAVYGLGAVALGYAFGFIKQGRR